MTEEEARDWLATRYPAPVLAKLEQYVALLLAESERQSLIARSTATQVWTRHIVDSAQLLCFADRSGPWLDVGSGGGIPGIVLAIVNDAPITLCEPRAKRHAFLSDCVRRLALGHASVATSSVQKLTGQYGVVTARAVGALDLLLSSTSHLVSRETRYILPRGAGAYDDCRKAETRWRGLFHVEPSITASDAGIVVASGVWRR